jgi:rhodanese-related sulfurtransferase
MTTATAAHAESAAEFFRAKLAYETTPHDINGRLKDAGTLILDVRDPESYKKEHIPGAKNVPLSELAKHVASLPKDKTLVTYCWSLTCWAAPKAALQLAEKGFKVQEMVGGIKEWKNNGFAVEAGK